MSSDFRLDRGGRNAAKTMRTKTTKSSELKTRSPKLDPYLHPITRRQQRLERIRQKEAELGLPLTPWPADLPPVRTVDEIFADLREELDA